MRASRRHHAYASRVSVSLVGKEVSLSSAVVVAVLLLREAEEEEEEEENPGMSAG